MLVRPVPTRDFARSALRCAAILVGRAVEARRNRIELYAAGNCNQGKCDNHLHQRPHLESVVNLQNSWTSKIVRNKRKFVARKQSADWSRSGNAISPQIKKSSKGFLGQS